VVGLNHPEWYSEFDVGPPTATDFGPNAALSGDQIVATDLEGWYEADNTQYLQAASLDLSEAPRSMLRLQTGRWLSVEKSEYDVARIRAVTAQVDELLWQNPYSYDVIDGGWRTQVVDMRHLHDAGPLSLVWTLGTDGGLEYAGWALDDVCISGLADPPGAYADASLAALPIGDTIELRWSDPWVVPLVETVLVRKHSTSPTGPEDGTVLMRVTDPVPGTERVVVDDTAAAFSRWDWHYALFASDAEGHWFTALRPGNIAALVDPVPEQPDTSVTDDDIEPLAGPTVTQVPLDDPGGCGCATGPGVGGGWWALGLLALARRRSVV
jgi:MYXO-CTERM domain-containing protein